jgi:hypothetical protein
MTRSSKKNDANNSNPYMSERMQMKLLQQELDTSADNEESTEGPETTTRRGRRNSKELIKEQDEEVPSSSSKAKPTRSSRRKAASPSPTPDREPELEKQMEVDEVVEPMEEEEIRGPTKRGRGGKKTAATTASASKKGGSRSRTTSSAEEKNEEAEQMPETTSSASINKMDIDDVLVSSVVPLAEEQKPVGQVAVGTSPDNNSDLSSKTLSHNSNSSSSSSKRPTIKILDNPTLKKPTEVSVLKQGNELISSSRQPLKQQTIKDPQPPAAPVDPLAAFDSWNDALQERIEKNKVCDFVRLVCLFLLIFLLCRCLFSLLLLACFLSFFFVLDSF